MTLKKKIASILLLIMVISSLVYFAVFKLIVFKGYEDAENSEAVHDMNQCITVLNLEIKHLDKFVRDWSSWDSTYSFVIDANHEFIDENLGITVYQDQGINIIHCYDNDGALVWGKTYDLETEEEIPLDLAEELGDSLFLKLINQKDPQGYTSGIIKTSIGSMIIASHPVLTSENAGPSHGAFIMGKLFAEESIASFFEQLDVDLEAWSVENDQMPDAVRTVVPLLNSLDSVRLVRASSNILNAYSVLRDIDGQPAIVLKASFPRLITKKGTRAYIVGMVFILGIGLLVFVSISGVFEVYVLKPIARLTENALEIGVSSRKPVKFDIERKDEIGVLSREFEYMVERLSTSEELYTKLVNSIPDIIVRTDMNGRVLFVNDYALWISGYSREEIEGRNMLVFVSPEDHERVLENVMLMMEGRLGPKEYTLIMKDGTRLPFEVNGDVLREEDGTPFGIVNVCREITLRMQAEETIRNSEEKYRQLAETAHDLIVTVDLDFNITYANKAVQGFSEGIDILGRSLLDFTPPELHQVQEEMMQKRREGFSDTLAFQWDLIHPNGKTKTFDIRATLLTDDGKPSGVMFIARDITERKKAEDTIRKSEERYRTIFESTATANVIIAEDSTILMANNDFANLSGYTREELEGKMSWTVFVHEDDLERMKTYHKKRRVDPESAPSSYAFCSKNRKGEIRDIIMKVAIIPETEDSVASMIDITEWKRSEQARFESEARFQELAELLPETVYEADEDGVFTFVNQTGFDKFGYDQGDLSMGKRVFDVIVPRDHPRMIATYKRLIEGGRVGLGEYTARKKNGSTFPALIHSTLIYRDGKPVGHRGFVIDLSEKKILEDQLAKAQKMEAIGTLAGGIAHDFNNLLMGILGNISLILLQVDHKQPIFDMLKSVEGYVQRGSNLTKQLLGFARGGKYEVKPTDLGQFIKESSELFGRTSKDIHIHHKTQEGLWTVEVDRGQMEQVFLNLYMNAWHAMPNGGDLYLFEENVELDSVSVSPYEIDPGRFVKVTVTDTGTGMDEATKSRIFEPFFTTKEQGRGTGLGLASAYGIIKNHGGFIHVESEEGVGTSFVIYLPASDRNVRRDRKVKEQLSGGSETLLLIDDEDMILEISAKMLEQLGYKVIVASGGKMGVQKYKQNKENIDLVILDMVMPDFSGTDSFDALARINPSVKVLLSSGYSLDSQAKEIMAKGCKGFIQKPFTLADLSRKIREILDKQ